SISGGLPTNQRAENNIRPNGLGIFMTPIWNGLPLSPLSPALQASDRPYVDGSYVIGTGSAAQDTRCQAIRSRIATFAQGIATVGMHEIGHSLGLVITSRAVSGHCTNIPCAMEPVVNWSVTTFDPGPTGTCTQELTNALGLSP
ncbi:MAG: hypothetical protein ACYTFG_08570, partial [Planctomycetota bacterium]